MRARTVAVLALAGAALVLGATGCTPTPADPASGSGPLPSATPSTAETTTPGSPPPDAVPPTFRPNLSASENLAFFDSVNQAVIAANDEAGGREFIDALTAAGFDKASMEVTDDRTTIDLEADSVQFAVLFQGECLIGQYGPASGGYHGVVRPALGTGGCLVGMTRPIDW